MSATVSNRIVELVIRTFTTPDDGAALGGRLRRWPEVALQSHGRKFVGGADEGGFRYDGSSSKRLTRRRGGVFLPTPTTRPAPLSSRAELETAQPRVFQRRSWCSAKALRYVDWSSTQRRVCCHTEPYSLLRSPKITAWRVCARHGIMQNKLVGYLNRTRMPFSTRTNCRRWYRRAGRR